MRLARIGAHNAVLAQQRAGSEVGERQVASQSLPLTALLTHAQEPIYRYSAKGSHTQGKPRKYQSASRNGVSVESKA